LVAAQRCDLELQRALLRIAAGVAEPVDAGVQNLVVVLTGLVAVGFAFAALARLVHVLSRVGIAAGLVRVVEGIAFGAATCRGCERETGEGVALERGARRSEHPLHGRYPTQTACQRAVVISLIAALRRSRLERSRPRRGAYRQLPTAHSLGLAIRARSSATSKQRPPHTFSSAHPVEITGNARSDREAGEEKMTPREPIPRCAYTTSRVALHDGTPCHGSKPS
jgi:hypothetical protein